MTAIHIEHSLKQPVERVWRALTDPERVARWLMPADTFRAEVGAEFGFDAGQWGRVACVVLASEPPRLLRYSWRNPPLDTVITFRLEPEGDGTRLVLDHDGFDLADPQQRFAYENMGRGWAGILTRLDALFGAE